MSEVLNLRLARKARKRAEAETLAAANRLRHGRTGAARALDTLEVTRARRVLDGAQLPSEHGEA